MLRKTLFTLGLGCLLTFGAHAQLSLSSSSNSASENFDSMWSTGSTESNSADQQLALPSNWKIDRNMAGPRQVCPWNDASSTIMYSLSENLPNNAANGTYCWGDSNDKSDRAVGGLTTGSVGGENAGTRGVSIMTHLKNNDANKILTHLNLNYNIEKYRRGINAAGFSVRIFTSADGEKWVEADELVTSYPADPSFTAAPTVPISTDNKDQQVRVHVEPGQEIYLAWNISVTSGTTCSSAPGYAIDDVVITGVFADSDDDYVEKEIPDSGIYIRGIDGWNAEQTWEFFTLSETQYALYNKTISGTFKIGDANWSSDCNYGTNGSNITMGEVYELESGSTSGDISCGDLSFPCSRILLTIEDGKATLLLEPNTDTEGLEAVYMVGDFNNWNYMNEEGKLTLDPGDNLFKGQVALTAAADGLSHWMIYQRIALAGAWGLADDAANASISGTLISGDKGHVATEPGMYNVAFNLATGEYNLELKPSEATLIQLSPAKVTLVPQNPEKVKVLSLNNSLIHYNDQAKVFNDIASSMNKDAVWTKHTNLGKTLDYHWSEGDGMTDAGEPGAKMMIRSDAWSHIILQEQTILPRTDFESFRNSVGKWVEYIRDNCPNPNAVIIVPMNWALGQDWSNFSNYNKILMENYGKVAKEFGVVICPVGLAYQSKYDNDGTQTEKDWFLPGDDRHPTLKATYMAALMEYGLIFNEDPTSVTYYPNYKTNEDNVGEMSDAIAAEMRQYASDALKNYQNVVDHHSASVALNAVVLDQFNLEMPDQAVTLSVTPNTAAINGNVFTAPENGEYTVTATSGDLEAKAVIVVTDAETEVPDLGWIELDEDNLEYNQDFDSMGYIEGDETDNYNAPIPEGWRADAPLKERTLGSFQTAGNTTLKSSHGQNFESTAKNGVWNFGDSSDLSDRALGGATTDADGGAKSINVYSIFRNAGKKAISSFDIAYDIEKYRGGSNSAGFTVQLYTSQDGKNWISAGPEFATGFEPDAQTAGADETPMETRHMSGTIDLDFVPGAEIFFAWNISASTGTSCMAAPLLALDNFQLSANLKPVPVFDYYIYIENQSPYEKTGLYAYSHNDTPSEIFGAWPGQNPINEVDIDGVHYEVFGHNQATGTYQLIYNNNNNGSQYNDYEVEAGRDYYLRANPNGLTLSALVDTDAVGAIEVSDNSASLTLNGDTLFCPEASQISVYSLSGATLANVNGNSMKIDNLQPGLYVATASTPKENVSIKFVVK